MSKYYIEVSFLAIKREKIDTFRPDSIGNSSIQNIDSFKR